MNQIIGPIVHWLAFIGAVLAAAADEPAPLRDKTLVVWAAPANLEQRGGSALTMDAGQGLFDGIVFGEHTARKWMPGSEAWRRTTPDQAEWPAETADDKTFVQIAIAYQDRQITIYRNGRPYAQYVMANPPMEFGPHSTVLIGKRHLDVGEGGRFAGTIDDARIYDRALTAEQIAALKPNVVSAIKPWAWWTFDDKAAKERTGRFETTRLYGGAKVQDGILVLDGKRAWLSTAKEGDVEDSVYECPCVNNRFLHIPIWSGVKNSWVNISVDGVWQRELAISLAKDNPDFYATLEVGQWQGRKLTLTAEKVDSDSQWSKLIKQSDEMSDGATVYTEKYRPQFHFSVRGGGLGDVNGPVYLNGEYHLFGQHWPFQGASARNPGSIVWAHAISTDLVHWVEYPVAVFPDKLGLPFSGSSVVDWENTAGLVKNPVMDNNGRLKNPAIVLVHTSYPLLIRSGGNTTQSMVYSLDSGRTWIKYPGNPVVPHFIAENRDPKVIRYEDKKNPGNPYSGRWVMVLYMSDQDYAVLVSKDLIHWERASGIDHAGCIDCPDMFELPVDGDKNNTRWVFWGGSGSHLIGKFDGQAFVKEAGPFLGIAGTEYAAQTFSDIPEEDGRRIQIANSSRANPGMPFEGQFTIARVLTLRTTPDGIRLFTEPAKEIEKLRTSQTLRITGTLAGADAPLNADQSLGELVDAEAVFELQSDALSREGTNVFGLRINGQTILCDLDQKQMKVADILAPLNCVAAKKIKLRVILDRMSIEVFVNDGAFRFTKPFVPADGMQPDIQVFGKQGLASVTLIAYQLQSIWNKKAKL